MMMTMFTALMSLGSIIHYTSGSLIRYWFVSTSLQPHLQEGFLSGRFYHYCLLIPHVLLLIHLLDGIYSFKKNGTQGFPLLLHQACLDPFSNYRIPFQKLMPFQQIMIYVYIVTIIFSNFRLYKYLRNVKHHVKKHEFRNNFDISELRMKPEKAQLWYAWTERRIERGTLSPPRPASCSS